MNDFTAVVVVLVVLILTYGLGFDQGRVKMRDLYNEGTAVIERCQKDLPRSEVCVLTAVPESELVE